jgi:hypothetical protein
MNNPLGERCVATIANSAAVAYVGKPYRRGSSFVGLLGGGAAGAPAAEEPAADLGFRDGVANRRRHGRCLTLQHVVQTPMPRRVRTGSAGGGVGVDRLVRIFPLKRPVS